MSTELRRMSIAQALPVARELAESFARSTSLEGTLTDVKPDPMRSNRVGKIPVHWVAVFSNVRNGVEYDGPVAFCVNLEERTVEPFSSL